MKKLFSLFLLLSMGLGLFTACESDNDDDDNSGALQNSCDPSNSAKNHFSLDAERLALQLQLSGPTASSPSIIPGVVDRMLGALAAVHDSEFAARDSVVEFYDIHANENEELYKLTLEIDTAAVWVKEWLDGERFTGNNDIDQLMSYWNLEVEVSELPIGTLAFLTSEEPLNMSGLATEFEGVDGVNGAFAQTGNIDGNNITAIDYFDYLDLTFSIGFDDATDEDEVGECQNDCEFRRMWTFRVTDECEVSYIGAEGDPAPGEDD